ncbi:hypothetical protein EVA_12500, partial [gut metagenome]
MGDKPVVDNGTDSHCSYDCLLCSGCDNGDTQIQEEINSKQYDMETSTVQMTQAELEQFRAFKAEQAKKEAAEIAKNMRKTYKEMVDEEIDNAIPELLSISQDIKFVKAKVIENFKSILEMKREMFRMSKGKELDNQSHTFTNSAGDKRIILGVYVTDGYLDTVEEGISIIREYIESLATDENTKALVGMVMRLLAKDQKGTLKASRVIQLRKVAEETGNERFLEGVHIIEEAYSPAI